jgi:hypothetical protein
MKNILCLIAALVIGLTSSTNIFADDRFPDDYLGDASSGLVFIPGKGYSWPPMGAPVTRYYYDTAGRSHLVEVDPFTLEVRRSPVDLNRLEGNEGRSSNR